MLSIFHVNVNERLRNKTKERRVSSRIRLSFFTEFASVLCSLFSVTLTIETHATLVSAFSSLQNSTHTHTHTLSPPPPSSSLPSRDWNVTRREALFHTILSPNPFLIRQTYSIGFFVRGQTRSSSNGLFFAAPPLSKLFHRRASNGRRRRTHASAPCRTVQIIPNKESQERKKGRDER